MERSWKKYLNKWLWLYIGIGVLVILLNIAAWNSTTFCDAYIAYVFPIWVNTYGRLTGVAPFSVGEILLGLGVMLLGLAGILWIPWLVTAVVRKLRKKSKPGAGRGFRIFYRFFAWTLLIVCLIMTLNCFILYHASTFSENYFGEDNGEYTLEELITVRNMVVEECNRLSLLMERDEEGNILYDGDLEQTAIESMQKLGKTYGRLDGYYPRPKPLYTSVSNICAGTTSRFPWRLITILSCTS